MIATTYCDQHPRRLLRSIRNSPSTSCCPARLSRRSDLDQFACLDVIDVPVDRDTRRHQWMPSNARDIVDYGLRRVCDCEPVDKLGFC